MLTQILATVLLIVVDGLRPDYVTPQQMPRLFELGQRGIVFNAHHSVFPTVTRVNGSTFVTGTYPETHGLLGNTIYVPAVSATKTLDTGDRENLVAVANTGPLLTAPTLGEILRRAGKRFAVFSSATTGATFILDQSAPARELPPHAIPNAAQHTRVVDAYLSDPSQDVAILWLSDPDSTAHQKGIGSPATRESLRIVDAEIGRIEDTLRANGQLTKTDIIVTSDHGFTTHNSHLRLEEVVKPLARTLADGSSDIVVAEGAIYFRGAADRARVAGVVAALQARPPVGAIFTRDGAIPGTLPYDLIRWNHPRSGDILVSANWNTEKNEFGYEGITTQTGTAGHGSSSPYDIHNTLIAVGPDFREHATSDAPTGNADIAPTILRAIGMTPLQTMTGRIIEEMFRTGPLPSSLAVTRTTNTVKNADGSYELTAHISTVAGSRYLDWTETRRK